MDYARQIGLPMTRLFDFPEVFLTIGIADANPLNSGHFIEMDSPIFVRLQCVINDRSEVVVLKFHVYGAVDQRFTVLPKYIENVLAVAT